MEPSSDLHLDHHAQRPLRRELQIHRHLDVRQVLVLQRLEELAQDKKSFDVMKAVLQLRWLIIDEISMVSARLLADIDLKLRSYYNTVDKFALDSKGHLRPFAGLNIKVNKRKVKEMK